MEQFKLLIEEQNRLETLKSLDELTERGLQLLTEINQALQLLQTAVVGQSEQLCECEISKPIDPYDSIDKDICRDCKCVIA